MPIKVLSGLYYIQVTTCDTKLLKISVPDSMSRVILDYMHWKGIYIHTLN